MSEHIVWEQSPPGPLAREAETIWQHWCRLVTASEGAWPRRREFAMRDILPVANKIRVSRVDGHGQLHVYLMGGELEAHTGTVSSPDTVEEVFSPESIEASVALHLAVQEKGQCLLLSYRAVLADGRVADLMGLMLPVVREEEPAVIGATLYLKSYFDEAYHATGRVELPGPIRAWVLPPPVPLKPL